MKFIVLVLSIHFLVEMISNKIKQNEQLQKGGK